MAISKNKQRINLTLPADVIELIKEEASFYSISCSVVVGKILVDYFENEIIEKGIEREKEKAEVK